MPPKSSSVSFVDELIKALQDKDVIEAIGNIFNFKVKELLDENARLKEELTEANKNIESATQKIEAL